MACKQTNPAKCKVLLLTLMNDIYTLNCFTIYKVIQLRREMIRIKRKAPHHKHVATCFRPYRYR